MLERGIYGIEYDPRQMSGDGSPGIGWLVVAVALVAAGSLIWTVIGRFGTSPDPIETEVVVQAKDPVRVASPEPAAPTPAPKPVPVAKPAAVSVEPSTSEDIARRPPKVRNLLMRREAAVAKHDIEMEVDAIEALRDLPGSLAADLDDKLARRLGTLNMRRLFNRKNPQWVKTVIVRRGDSASRLAAEHGSTLSSLQRLNDGKTDRIVVGNKLYVMNHPRFNLVIHLRSRTADLSLNGKFFKRYDLVGKSKGKVGTYSVPVRWRNFWIGDLGIQLKPEDRAELETLLPTSASVIVVEV